MDQLSDKEILVLRYFSAARQGNTADIEDIVNEGFKDILAVDEWGNTTLHAAAGAGHLDCCKYLVETLKIPLDQTNKQGDTALHKAAWRGALDVVKYLIDKDCKLEIKNKEGKKPVDLAHHLEVKSYLQSFIGDDDEQHIDDDEDSD
ncbi:hypothetical protein ABK040_007581 [Willaertia magna]